MFLKFSSVAGTTKWKVIFRWGLPLCLLLHGLPSPDTIKYTIFLFSTNTFIMFISYKLSHKLRKAKTTDVQQYKQAVLAEKRYSVSFKNCILLGFQSSLHWRVREVIWWFPGLFHNNSLEGCVSQDTCTCSCSCPCNSILGPHRNVRHLSGI